jgi:hypothetical protein
MMKNCYKDKLRLRLPALLNLLMKLPLQRDPEGKKQLHRAHATTSQRTAGYQKVATD